MDMNVGNFEIEHDTLVELYGEPKKCWGERNSDRDLVFNGWLVGEGNCCAGTGRSTHTRIYLTTGGNVVVEIERRTSWQGEHDRHDAKLCRSVEEILNYMREDYDGCSLGRSSKEAVDNIGYKPLLLLAIEEVE